MLIFASLGSFQVNGYVDVISVSKISSASTIVETKFCSLLNSLCLSVHIKEAAAFPKNLSPSRSESVALVALAEQSEVETIALS